MPGRHKRRNVGGALRDEPDAHALGTDEADHLFNLVGQCLGGAFEKHVRLVEEEYQLGTVGLAHFRQRGIQLGQQPQQEGGIELGLEHELVSGQYVHDAFSGLALQKVVNVEVGFAEELLGALVFQAQQSPLDGADGRRRHVAVLGGVFRGVLPDEVEHGAEVFQVYQQKAVVVGDAENDVQHAGLGFVEVEEPPEHVGAHAGDGGAQGVALFAVNVEEADGAGLECRVFDAEFRHAFLDEAGGPARLGNAAQVTLHVGHETGDAGLGEGFGHHLQGDGLAGSRRPGNQSVAAQHLGVQRNRSVLGMGHIQPSVFV